MNREIVLPEACLVVMVGPTASGKTDLAGRLFSPDEILQLDMFRRIFSPDPRSPAAVADGTAVMREAAARRLKRGMLTVIDAPNLRREDRAALIGLARSAYLPAVAVVTEASLAEREARNARRADPAPRGLLREEERQMPRIAGELEREDYLAVVRPDPGGATVRRVPLRTDLRRMHGPFDFIGDVHGCIEELLEILAAAGYEVADRPSGAGSPGYQVSHSDGRTLVFTGDLTDRGPDAPAVLGLVMDAVASGAALCVRGNHDDKLARHLAGRTVNTAHGFAETLEQMGAVTPGFRSRVLRFLGSLPSHYVLNGGRVAVCHAGIKEAMIGRDSTSVTDYCMYGPTTGETDEDGLPVRLNWEQHYQGRTAVVYGHTPRREASWEGNTICLDTGCAFGGSLTMLRWPERHLISVPARRVYCLPRRRLDAGPCPAAR